LSPTSALNADAPIGDRSQQTKKSRREREEKPAALSPPCNSLFGGNLLPARCDLTDPVPPFSGQNLAFCLLTGTKWSFRKAPQR
jgi:hypothetical protein